MKKENQKIQPMETTKVIIENWPKDPWIKTWIPIIIALISIIVSWVSLNYTKKEFIRNTRPHVWAINAKDSNSSTNIPQQIVLRLSNSPAKIINLKVLIFSVDGSLKNEIYKSNPEGNYLRFPDEKANWQLTISPVDWNKILTTTINHSIKLERHIIIQYSSLDGGQLYNYKMVQEYVPNGNDWLDKDVQAN